MAMATAAAAAAILKVVFIVNLSQVLRKMDLVRFSQPIARNANDNHSHSQ
jgi:hypothetical protein